MHNVAATTTSATRAWQGGRVILFGGLVAASLLTLLAAAMLPLAALAIPAIPIIVVAAWQVFKRPVLNLVLILSSFAFIARFKEGFQVEEILFAVYLVAFFGYWLLQKAMKASLGSADSEDRTLLLFLGWTLLTIPLTILFRGSITGAVSEWTALLMLGFYFPVKEVVSRSPNGYKAILAVVLWLAMFASIRNLLFFRELLLRATQVWQAIHGRFALNEVLLLVGALACLTLLIHIDSRKLQTLLAGATVLLVVSLILTKSRAYWIDFAVGVTVLGFVVNGDVRRRLVLWTLSSIAGVVLLGLLLFGDLIWQLGVGFLDRVLSIFTAAQTDISLINRFHESRFVWREIIENPIIGHGMGVKYRSFDIIDDVTIVRSYTHNGIFSLWFKFGLIGLVLFCVFWARVTLQGIRAYRSVALSRLERACGLIAFLGLLTFLPSVATSNPFFLSDTLIMIGILSGWSSGLALRARREN